MSINLYIKAQLLVICFEKKILKKHFNKFKIHFCKVFDMYAIIIKIIFEIKIGRIVC